MIAMLIGDRDLTEVVNRYEILAVVYVLGLAVYTICGWCR